LRIYEIIAHSRNLKILEQDNVEWLDAIEQDCQQYLSAVKTANKWLLRGHSPAQDAYVATTTRFRQPSDTHPEAQKLFDQILAIHGFVAVRGNSIFATSDPYKASNYGEVYVIFPVDHYSHFTYTTENDLSLETPEDLLSESKSQEWLRQLRKWMREYEKQKGWDPSNSPVRKVNLLSLLDLNDEWTRHGLDLAELPERFRNMRLIDLVDIREFMQKYQPSSTNLVKALKSGVEVYIAGKYYALKLDVWGDAVAQRFGVPPKGT
jgi:hypothetical protein